ncbi:hypothetical protein [Actinokineospora globicatena]|uniref:hypothetical protein n=1 Tax=Actinokineospora globicatena TaxID=103729 RepID=UPI0020A37AD2|nr:hypothetical protein [Actinokineospora globicatena]MCP2302201.1 hypothetical protein [Actinokineospora globicatena]GLW76135.1 hypothetical protein Aglo01_06170 [Actinokineospora globicatena]GLW82971.1 hypothetical protein Aglo02_06110 [Actinokineospora globicatena]
MDDLKTFRGTCHALARRTTATHVEFRVATGVTPNFHECVLTYRTETIAVVATRTHAFTAVARPTVSLDAGPLTFVDHPALLAELRSTPYRALSFAELDAPFRAEDWPHVLPSDIKYWHPTTVGEALFNHWD